MKKKAISILSGGLDSLVASSYYAKDYDIHAITFDYGQKALAQELESASKISKYFGFKHTVINLDWLKKISTSSLTSTDSIPHISEDNLEDIDFLNETRESVWVPGRNTVFTSIGLSFAESVGGEIIIVGWDKEEAETFPDNSKEFLNSFNKLIKDGSPLDIKVKAPLIDLNKEEIVKLGVKLNTPFELSYSCYEGLDTHCGVCESCIRRKRAFKLCGVEDPTVYKN